MIKLLIIGRRRPGMTTAELHAYMLDVHGRAVVDLAARKPGAAPGRYVQNHAFDATYRSGTEGPFTGPRDFVTQVWFDSPEHSAAASSAPEYVNELQPDELNFVDLPAIVLPVQESILKPRPANTGLAKLFLLRTAIDPGDAEALVTQSQERWLSLLTASSQIEGVVCNRVLKPPAVAEAHVVDEIWLESVDACRRVLDVWRGSDASDTVAEQPVVAILAREHVLIPGSA